MEKIIKNSKTQKHLEICQNYRYTFRPEVSNPLGSVVSIHIGHPTSGSGGKKTFKLYLKSEHTDKRTHGHTGGQIDL